MNNGIKVIDVPVACAWQQDGGPDPMKAYCREKCPLFETRCHWQKKVLLWALVPGASFMEQVLEAALKLTDLIGDFDGYVFMQSPPELECTEVTGDLYFIQADWVPDGFMALWSDALREVKRS